MHATRTDFKFSRLVSFGSVSRLWATPDTDNTAYHDRSGDNDETATNCLISFSSTVIFVTFTVRISNCLCDACIVFPLIMLCCLFKAMSGKPTSSRKRGTLGGFESHRTHDEARGGTRANKSSKSFVSNGTADSTESHLLFRLHRRGRGWNQVLRLFPRN